MEDTPGYIASHADKMIHLHGMQQTDTRNEVNNTIIVANNK